MHEHSAFAWSWLGAAMQATSLPFGVVNAPGQRYHPAIVAQAIATLEEMYEGRFWAALGTGEASNEHITGDDWPRKDVRNARLRECVDIIRALLDGETVSSDGLVKVDRAKVWTRPRTPPPLVGAAVSVETAAWVAEWADGLITIAQPPGVLREMLDAYSSAGGRGKAHLQVHLSYAETDAAALALAHEQWRTNVFAPPVCWDLEMTEHFDEAAKHVPPEAMREAVMVGSEPEWFAEQLAGLAELGFDEIYLHHVGNRLEHQREFVEVFGAKVLPQLDVTTPVARVPAPAPWAQRPAAATAEIVTVT